MRIKHRATRCRGKEVLAYVSAVHFLVSVPFADPLLCKDASPATRQRMKKVNLFVGTGAETEGWPRLELPPCVAEQIVDLRYPLRIASLVFALYAV